MKRHISESGFTLIELLIVVGIISILASLAMPNFLEAQTRAKVSRAKNDMRVIALALEAYAVDLNAYPYRTPASTSMGWAQGFGRCDYRVRDMKALTTPISYISQVPSDIFAKKDETPNNVLDYWSPALMTDLLAGPRLPEAKNKTPGFVLLSVGPDGHVGYAAGTNYQGCQVLDATDPIARSIYRTYDPSNGTVSLGNIFRLQSGGESADVFYQNGGGF